MRLHPPQPYLSKTRRVEEGAMREYWWINTRARDMLREAFAAQLQGDQAQNITAEERRQSLESQLRPEGSPAANAATCCVLACRLLRTEQRDCFFRALAFCVELEIEERAERYRRNSI